MQLISKYDALKKSVPQVVDTYSGLKLERETLLNSIAITKLHLSLVGDGTSCSRCGQSLENVLHREDHASLRLKEKELAQRLSVVSAAIAAWERKESIEREMESVKAAAQAYPKFGRTLASVKEELATLKALDSEWARYRISKEAYARNEQVRETLLAKLTTLGYPDVLTREVPCVRSLQERVKKLKEGIACLSLVKSLRQRVLNYPAKADVVEKLGVLEREVQALEAEEAQLLSETGACRAKLSFVSSLLASKEELEGKLAASESLYNEYRILKALVKFFSPAGFKSYELRKRCEPLIDVANYWSPLFFSELHEWSLPKDYDSLEFLVQPVAHRKSVAPFPARLLSAGEENRAERILLFAQLGLAPKNKTVNTLFLDEIEGNLDAAGRTLFTEVVIPKLKETFPDRCIVIISHDDSMKNLSCIDHLWLVERRNRKSTLKVFENSGGNVA
jgi:DNA repair exonuclease SbcCD ATPase subunit